MSVKITEAERLALRGVSLASKCAYMLCFRWVMDYKTGVTGWVRRINWMDVWAEIEEEPDQGSTQKRVILTVSQKKKKVRVIIDELIRAGLLKPKLKNGKRLPMIFECILAARDSVSAGGTAHERREQRHTSLKKNNSNSVSCSDTPNNERRSLKPKSGTYPVSGNNIYFNKSCSTVRVMSTTLQNDKQQSQKKCIAENFEVTARHHQFANQHQTPNPDTVVIKFVKYYQSSGIACVDWDARFEMFLLTEKEFQQRRSERNGKSNDQTSFIHNEKPHQRITREYAKQIFAYERDTGASMWPPN